ncbi:hypothetical protein K378_05014 [Streptomyces sp. Amel2xB2]|nr:hypothetical protein K378_05014 [Streptomyces sp. Amel2xB2]
MTGARAWAATVRPGHADAFKNLGHLWRVTPLTWRDQRGHGAASAFTSEVDLARQAAPGPSESLIGAVVPRRRSFRDARLLLAGTGRALMGTAGRRVDAGHAPVDPARQIGVRLDGTQDPIPRTVRRPTPVTLVNGLPTAETLRQIAPRYPRAHTEQDPLDHLPVIHPAATALARRWQVRLQPAPLSTRWPSTPQPVGQPGWTSHLVVGGSAAGSFADALAVAEQTRRVVAALDRDEPSVVAVVVGVLPVA